MRRPRLSASVLLCLVGCLVGLVLPIAPSSAAVADGAIVAKIVHSDRTITFVVRMSLYPACAEPRCAVTPQIARDIRRAIERVWNNAANKYKCYTVRVQPEISVSRTPLTDAADRVAVRIDRSPVPIRSQVLAVGAGNPLSSSATAILRPTNTSHPQAGPSQWAYPPRTSGTYAHEFAHVIGLEDTYDANGRDIPGSPHDLLNTGMHDNPPKIDASTIARLVKRHGIRDGDLQCAWKLVYSGGGVSADGVKCGTPVGTWALKMRIAAAVRQRFGLTISIGRDLAGTWRQAYNVSVPGAGTSGVHTGTAKFAYGPPPTMTVSDFGTIRLRTFADCPR